MNASALPFDYCLDLRGEDTDWRRIAESGQMFRWHAVGDGWLICDGDAFFFIQSQSTGGNGSLNVRANRPVEDLHHLLRLDVRVNEVLQTILERGPEFAACLPKVSGLRLLRPLSPSESFLSFLCASNNNVLRIRQLVGKLEAMGEKVGEFQHEEVRRTLFAFPTVSRVAECSEEELRSAGFGYRGKTIPFACRELLRLAGGDESRAFAQLKTAGYDEAWRALAALPGIGRKLADCICLFALDQGESVPIDTHIWAALTRLYYPDWAGLAVTESRYRIGTDTFRERFGELSAWAQQLLFVESLEGKLTRNSSPEDVSRPRKARSQKA